jgi:hypothetical protein
MVTFHPRLLEAANSGMRMDALCDFIEFWLGPRTPSYGESGEAVSERSLPMPLKRIYEFAGRWPNWDRQGPIGYAVPALSHQDSLATLKKLQYEADGKVTFLHENQGVWDCRTLADGDDPPVWCYGDQMDQQNNWFHGEKLICDSLSRFLTTFVLQELALGSRLYLCDETLTDRFVSERDSAVPVWTNGPYVHGSLHDFHLWRNVLVAELWGDYFLAANHEESIAFLTQNQGPIDLIDLMMGLQWRLDVRSDGSACIRYRQGQIDEAAEAPAETFNFEELLAKLSAAASGEGHYELNAMVFFHRQGQSGGLRGKHLHDSKLVRSLFRLVLKRSVEPNKPLERRFAAEWPDKNL